MAMSNRWIYEKVNELVEKYKTRNPEELAKALDINIKYMDETKTLLGMYQVILKNRYIFIPNNLGSLKDTVLAHEIGHDQLHREESLKGVTFHESRVFNPVNVFEIEANIFAAHLLIPDDDLLNMMKYAESDRDLAVGLGVDINLLNLKISELVKLNIIDLKNIFPISPDSGFLKKYKPRNDLD